VSQLISDDFRMFGQVFRRSGTLYVPLGAARFAAGPFLPASMNAIDEYVVLPPVLDLRTGIWDQRDWGLLTHRRGLMAAIVTGNSMVDHGIFDGGLLLFERTELASDARGRVVVIEKLGDDEGFGSWSVKKLIVEKSASIVRNSYGEEVRIDDDVIVLRSYNQLMKPWLLDRNGRYRVRGVFCRCLPCDVVTTMEVEDVYEAAKAGDIELEWNLWAEP
jgi:hypothetical protein